MKRKPRVQSTRVGAQRQWRSEHDGSPGSCRVCGRGVYDSLDPRRGRVKAAAGELAGDRSLKARGRKDQAKGKGKEAVGRAKNAADELTRRRKKPEG